MASRRQKLMGFLKDRSLCYAYFAKEGFTNRAITCPAVSTFTRASTKTDWPRGGAMQLRTLTSGEWPGSGRSDPAVTNLCLQSQTLNVDGAGAPWTHTRATVSANGAVAPDGTTTMDQIVEDNSATATHLISQGVTVVSGTTYTFSCYVKANTRSWINLDLTTSFAAGVNSYFDVGNGVLGTLGAGAPTARIESTPLPGVYRCSITKAATASAGTVATIFLANADGGISYSGDAASGLYVWGVQIEAGLAPRPYIPTTTVAVATIADVLTANLGLTTSSSTGARSYIMLYEHDYGIAQLTASGTMLLHNLRTGQDSLEILRNGSGTGWQMNVRDENVIVVGMSHTTAALVAAGTHVAVASLASGDTNFYIDGFGGTADTDTWTWTAGSPVLYVANSSSANRQPAMRMRALIVLDYKLNQQEVQKVGRLLKAFDP